MDDRAALQAEQADLQRKLKKRDGMLGYAANVAAIRERLAEIEKRLADG